MMVLVVYLTHQEKLLVAGRNNMEKLYEEYFQLKFPLSTGSTEWWDIKTDFEVLDDTLIGLSSTLEIKKIDPQELEQSKNFIADRLHVLNDKIDSYIPQDDEEKFEKEVVAKKIVLADQIYNALVKKYNI